MLRVAGGKERKFFHNSPAAPLTFVIFMAQSWTSPRIKKQSTIFIGQVTEIREKALQCVIYSLLFVFLVVVGRYYSFIFKFYILCYFLVCSRKV